MDKKKSIIITGAASGIGRETALLFGKRGWFVGIFDVNTPLLKVPQKVFCIEKMGVNIEPIQVAETVWKAAHRKKLHWKIGAPTFVLIGLFWLMPFLKRFVVKFLTIQPHEK